MVLTLYSSFESCKDYYTLIITHKIHAACMNIQRAMHMQALRERSHSNIAALDRCAEHFRIQ